MRNCLVPPGKFQVLSNCLSSFVSFKKIDWHASDSAKRVKPALFSLLCAWHEVLILRQQVPTKLKSHMKQELIDHFSEMLLKQYGIKPK
jgi:hypothetical protein